MNTTYHTILALLALAAFASCGKNAAEGESAAKYKGIVINEISAHDETVDADSWVELLNTSSSSVDLSGVGLYLSDQYFNRRNVWTAPEGTSLSEGERIVISTSDESLSTGIASDSEFSLKLALSSDGAPIDEVTRSTAFADPVALSARGSYQRIPDGEGQWQSLTYSSKGKENEVMTIEGTRPNGIWLWSSHRAQWLENDCAVMKEMKSKGYDHVFLNSAAFNESARKTTLEFIEAAQANDITVHAWVQCFYEGGWVCPVDDDSKTLKQDLFDRIIARAKSYLEDYGVKGLHLDYIRFPGTASKHAYPEAGIYNYTAVTEFCRQIREAVDAYDEGIVLSAAMMPERNTTYAYGQDKDMMSEYLDILIPMVYKGNYNAGNSWMVSMSNYFAANTHKKPCWSGIQTYQGDDNVTPLSTEELLSDCQLIASSNASGVVLFRYPLGDFPDVSDLWNSK